MKKFLPIVFLVFLLSMNVHALGTVLPIDPNMILYWHLNNNASIGENTSFVVDSSRGGINGSLLSKTYFNSTGGFLGDGAYIFNDSSNSGILAGNPQIVNSSSLNFSVATWIFLADTNGNNHRIIDRRTGNNGFLLSHSGSQVTMFVGNGTSLPTASTGNILVAGKWYYIVGTYNGTNSAVYSNGAFIAAASLLNYNSSNQNITVGRDISSTSFNGTLDEIAIYNRTLSQTDIWNNYMTYNQCLNLTEDINLYGNTTLCTGNYSLNDSAANSVLIVKNPGSIIDFNNSNATGNNTISSTATSVTSLKGVTIQNGFFSTYYNQIYFNNANNSLAKNLILYNSTNSGVDFSNGASLSTVNNITSNYSNIGVEISASNFDLITNSFLFNSLYGVRIETGASFENITNTLFSGSQGASPNSIYALSNTYNLLIANINVSNAPQISLMTNNSVIRDSIFSNITPSGSAIIASGTSNNWTIDNLSITNSPTNISDLIDISKLSNANVKNSYFETAQKAGTSCIKMNGASNINLTNITCRYGQYGIFTQNGANNIIISGSTSKDGDQGVNLEGMANITFTNNTIINTTANYDTYDLGLKAYHLNYSTIANTAFSQMASGGIFILGSQNISITGNTFNFISWSNRSNYSANDLNDPPCAIKIGETYKSYLGGGLEPLGAQNGSYINTFDSSNIALANNTFDSNTQCYLWSANNAVISNTLTNYTYWHFQAASNIYNPVEIYMNAQYTNLSRYSSGILNDTLLWQYNGKTKLEYRVHKNYLYFRNVNTSDVFDVATFNLTNGLVYTDNMTIQCANIGLCTQSNTTLAYNSAEYILQNFNLTEGQNREFSPFNISNGSTNQKFINSTLTTNVSNLTIIINTGGIVSSNLLLTFPDGSSQNPAYSYGNNTLTLTTTLPPGVSTLYLNTNIGVTGLSYNLTPASGVSPSVASYACFASATNAPVHYLVDFGDGTNSTSVNGTHTFAVGGTYTTRCTAYDVFNVSDSTTVGVVLTQGVSGGSNQGSSGSDLAQQESNDVTGAIKPVCSVVLAPQVLAITDDAQQVTLHLKNTGGSGVTLRELISPVEGYNIVSLTTDQSLVSLLPGATSDVTVSYVQPLFGHSAVDTKMALVLLSDSCADVHVPVTVRLSSSNKVSLVPESVFAYLHEPVTTKHQGVPTFLVYLIVTGIVWVCGLWTMVGAFKKSFWKGIGLFFLLSFVSVLASTGIVLLARVVL